MFTMKENVNIDVHRDLIGRSLHNSFIGIDKEELWNNKRELSLGGVRFFSLDIYHTLLYLCLHVSMQHAFLGLKWFIDINEFINKYQDEIDWAKVLRLAEKYRIRRPVYYTLLFTIR